jgi:type VI secretion system secreted protein Hcp
MASDYFLKIDGITGESQDDKHKDEIDLLSFSWGVSNAAHLTTGGGAGAGRASFQDFHFTSKVSSASPKLFLACVSGQHIKTATLTASRSTEEGRSTQFYKVNFSDILISSYQDAGSGGDDGPEESISFAFGKIEVVYTPQSRDGAAGTPIEAIWNLGGFKQ